MAGFPTNWNVDGNGLKISSEGFGVVAGLTFAEFRVTGTANNVVSLIGLEKNQTVVAAVNQQWAQSFFLWRVAGDLTGINTFRIRTSERDAAGGFNFDHDTDISVTDAMQPPFSHTKTLVESDTAFLLPRLAIVQLSSGAVDVTLRLALPALRKVSPVVYTDAQIIEIRRLPVIHPSNQSFVGYAKNHTVDNGEGIDVAATPAFKIFAGQEFRTSQTPVDQAVEAAHKGSEERRINTALQLKTDADAEATRLQALHGVRRDMFEIDLKSEPFAVAVGDVVTVQSSRFGLSAGKKFIVVSLTEDAALNEITVQVWG